MGIPVESLLERMYYNTARKVALKEVDEGLDDRVVQQSGQAGVGSESKPSLKKDVSGMKL